MALVKSGLFTEFRGKLGETEFRKRKNKKIELSKKRVPRNPRSEKQQMVRRVYGKCVEEWKKLSAEKKHEYQARAGKLGLDGYRLFMKECLKSAFAGIWYEITIDNSANANDLIDYQILLEIVNDDQFFVDCAGNRVYLEFYDEDRTTLLNHYVEEWDTENHNAKIWIKIPQIPASAVKKIYLFINKDRTEDLSNPEAVFDFWDDFETLDNWDVHESAGNVRVENSLLILDGSNSATGGINGVRSKTTFSYPIAIDFKLIVTAPTTNWSWKMFGVFDTPLTAGHPFEGNNAVGRNQEGTPYFRTMKDGNSTRVDVDSITDWHVETIIWTDNKAQNLWDYQLKAEITENIPTVPLYIELGVGNNAGAEAIKCDWVRVRKYTDPEPSISYRRL